VVGRLRTLAGIATLALVSWSPAPGQERTTPIGIEDILGTRSIPWSARVSLSPDGKAVAYVAKGEHDARRQGRPVADGVSGWAAGADIWIADVGTGASTNITGGKGSSWGPVWSPSGSHLAFVSDRNGPVRPWLWAQANGELRQAAEVVAIPRGYGTDDIHWAPDGRRFCVKVLPEGMTADPAVPSVVAGDGAPGNRDATRPTVVVRSFTPANSPDAVAPPAGGEDLNRFRVDIASVEVSGGRFKRVVVGARPLEYWVSPGGEEIAYTNLKAFGSRKDDLFENIVDLIVVPLSGGPARTVAGDVGLATSFAVAWSPDGGALAYTNSSGECCFVPAAGGPPLKAAISRREFGDRAPLWDAEGRSVYLHDKHAVWRVAASDGTASEVAQLTEKTIVQVVATGGGGTNMGRVGGGTRVWSPDAGRSLVISTHDARSKRVGFARMDARTGRISWLIEEDKYYGLPPYFNVNTDATSDGRSMVYLAQDARHSDDVWMLSGDLTRPRRVTTLNPSLERAERGTNRIIDWHDLDGRTLQGGLLLPARYREGGRYPLVVVVYGGHLGSNDVNRFGFSNVATGTFNMQLLASRGYAVLVPDAPVRPGRALEDLAKAVLPGVEKVVSLGIADPDRIGVMGHSYGGYGAMCLLVQTTRFKAAVVRSGFANLVGVYGSLGGDGSAAGTWSAEVQGGMRGSPWQFRDRYIENSPLFRLDRIESPVLLVHGSSDNAFLADEIFVGLRHLGKEVVYAKYGGEGHMQVNWDYANRIDSISRIIDWFDSHLKRER
jgi:dipeptidyl aminopeptidase/acylaminoacyl peptidase